MQSQAHTNPTCHNGLVHAKRSVLVHDIDVMDAKRIR